MKAEALKAVSTTALPESIHSDIPPNLTFGQLTEALEERVLADRRAKDIALPEGVVDRRKRQRRQS